MVFKVIKFALGFLSGFIVGGSIGFLVVLLKFS